MVHSEVSRFDVPHIAAVTWGITVTRDNQDPGANGKLLLVIRRIQSKPPFVASRLVDVRADITAEVIRLGGRDLATARLWEGNHGQRWN